MTSNYLKLFPLLAGVFFHSTAALAAAEDLTVARVDAPAGAMGSSPYVSNRAPLRPSVLVKLPIGSITPRGWLHDELRMEADGMAGHMSELSHFCKFENNAWTDPNGKGENGWEEVPYWIKGYGDLGYVLDDARVNQESRRWIDAILASQRGDGFFGPEALRTALDGHPDTWPLNAVLCALRSFNEHTNDPRVIPFMQRFFKWQNALPAEQLRGGWGDTRYSDFVESVYWLYNRTGDAFLLELADKMHHHSADFVHGIPTWHNVNLAEGFREPAEFAQQVSDPLIASASQRDYDEVMNRYGQVPGGGFAGDENCRAGFGDPRQGFETCGIVEFMHSFEVLTRITANPAWADRCEDLAFNSLPAATTPDLRGLHYLTCPNSIQLDRKNRHPDIDDSDTMVSYSAGEVYRCCQHNFTMGWPYYAESLWLGSADGGLCASLYCASSLSAKVVGGSTVSIEEQTAYPFDDSIQFIVRAEKPTKFPLYLRIPAWCQTPTVQVNGVAAPIPAAEGQYIRIEREWAQGDNLTLKLPMHISLRKWRKNKDSVSVDRGPLTYALAIEEQWKAVGDNRQFPDFEVFAATPWNWGLVLNEANPADSFEVVQRQVASTAPPFTSGSTPIELRASARQIPLWKADKYNMVGLLQQSPVRSDQRMEKVRLIPMGAARLRISAFPVIGNGSDAHDWQPPLSITASASFCNPGDSADAMFDDVVPARSSETDIPRFTWWNHLGTREWVQYDFDEPRDVSSAEIYWFDDTGGGGCRVPASWSLLYRDGNEWRPVEKPSAFETKADQFNRVTFSKVRTRSLRAEVQLAPGFSGGVLQWRVHE